MATNTPTLDPVADSSWPDAGAWTYQDYLRLPDDGKRYEIINGDLIEMPAPNTLHQIILANLAVFLRIWVKQRNLGTFLFAPVDVLLSNATQVLQPDGLFIAADQMSILQNDAVNGSPRLLIEILSPSTTRHDRTTKLDAYEQAGVKEYWIINPKTESLEIYYLEAAEYALAGEYTGDEKPESPVLGKLEFALSELFVI